MSSNIVPFSPSADSLVDIRMDTQRYPRIKALPQPVAIDRLGAVVAMAFNYTGREYSPELIAAVASALYAELMADDLGVGTANITIEEAGRAVRRAVLGETEMYGINVSSLYKVICAYATGEGHDAQVTANNRHRKLREAQLKASAAGAMLQVYSGKLLNHTTTKK